ncbi:MAG TPA: 4-hydroxy-3-methylbut-2-enyl diphosphate reductase [Acetobacteraceae bacterium]|jgi:4-hydroxy-3-methylbut-2-en-1-yl diphosphate reductase|nr:4-hydroxy-3-methylbut-2-enyl diphosphate reductase [Acetobacteraceae bacterium]
MRVVLANPRGFCAGVERAISTVEAALEQFGGPIYVRHEIVHNRHVLAALTRRGAVFVEDLQDVPLGARVIFSAHGVAPTAWREARARALKIIDATCPLVTKVHLEAVAHARAGRTLLVIGHRGHPEVVGTVGQYLGAGGARIEVIEDRAMAEKLVVDGPEQIAYVTQTTLSADYVAGVVVTLQRKFPRLLAPHREDICYATSNRQRAVQAIAGRCDVVIVIGADHSSNSARLCEVAQAAGVAAYLVDSDEKVDRAWFRNDGTIGVTSGASVPEVLVEGLLAKFRRWWPDLVEETLGEPEKLHFRVPREVDRAASGRSR